MTNSKKGGIITFIAGIAAGAVGALMLTPKSGEETRRTVRRTANKVSHDLNDVLSDGLEKLQDLKGKSSSDGRKNPTVTEINPSHQSSGTEGSKANAYGAAKTGTAANSNTTSGTPGAGSTGGNTNANR